MRVRAGSRVRTVRVAMCAVVVLLVSSAVGGIGAVASSASLGPVPAAVVGRAPKGSKLSPRLAALAAEPAASGLQSSALSLPSTGEGSLVQRANGSLVVEIRTADVDAATVRGLEALGAQIVNVSSTYSTVTADVPPTALQSIASDTAVRYVSEVLAPRVQSVGTPAAGAKLASAGAQCGNATSEGDALMNVATARNARNLDGTGETVGVLSDSFDTAPGAATRAATDVATGDLPGAGNPCGYTTPVVVQSDYSGGGQTDEGRAMAQLVHDLAPGAKLAFATASNGDLDFASQIVNMRSANHANVIVDDAAYLNEPFFQDGPIANAAKLVDAFGATYISAAGNSNVIVNGIDASSYETPSFRTIPCPAAVIAIEPVAGCHDFDTTAGTDNGDSITLAPGGGFGLDLQWPQPWGGVTTDYDAFVVGPTGAVLAGSAIDNRSSEQPFEFLGYSNPTGAALTVRIVIARFNGANTRLKFVLVGASGITGVQYDTSVGGDVVGPTIFGHSGAAAVGSTAAISYADSSSPEDYSSRGPVTLYFNPTPSFTALASPQVVNKPDFAATDDVQNTFFGEQSLGIWRFAGTSAAAPQAAAIAALLTEDDPALSTAQIRSTLRSTAQPVTTNGTSSDVGGGYLDANAALASVVALPAAPTTVSATAGNTKATVQWSAATTNPNFPVTGYVVTPSVAGVQKPPQTFNTAATTATATGLTNGVTYTFSVTARDANGLGPSSASSSPIIVGTPLAPTSVTAVPGNGAATVSWVAPTNTNGSPVTGYTVTAVSGSGNITVTAAPTATRVTVPGLTNQSEYSFEVAAVNAAGTGPQSKPSLFVTIGAPLAPTMVSATPGNASAIVQWTAPPDNGSAITGYVVTPNNGGPVHSQTFMSTSTTETLTNLFNLQRDTFRVQAVNPRGTGPLGASSAAIVIGAPTAPTSVIARPGNGAATITWTPPTTDNGMPVTVYTITPSRAGVPQPAQSFLTPPTDTKTITGLTNAASYTFTIDAENGNGPGVQSQATAPIVVGSPLAPTSPTATPGNGAATVRWVAPATNGAAISAYVVTAYVGTVATATHTFASTATTAVMTGLTNGTSYRFAVAATNARGIGPQSLQTTLITVGAPIAPAGVTATPGPARVTLHWTAPTVINGAAITGYVVTTYLAGVAQTSTTFHSVATTEIITGLTSGGSYTFAVAATNSRGVGALSSKSVVVKPT